MSIEVDSVRGNVTPLCADAICGTFSSREKSSRQGQPPALSCRQPGASPCRSHAMSGTARRITQVLHLRGLSIDLVQESPMSETISPLEQLTAQHAHTWVQYLPEGAVSVDIEGRALVLRASQPLQERFEALLAGRKAGTLSPEAA